MNENGIKIGNRNNGSIGDCLWITPVFKKLIGSVQLHDDAQCRKVAPIYNGICNVEHIEQPLIRVDKLMPGKYHAAQKILDFFNITDVNCIPFIKLTENEIAWAKNKLQGYINPIAIMPDNAGTKRNDNPSGKYREIPVYILNFIVKELINNGYTPIQFGVSSGFNDIDGTIKMLDLTVREMAACYHVIGSYIGGDTGGGNHLALASGAKTYVLIPNHNINLGFDYDELLYFDYLWKDEPIRTEYINFKDFKKVLDFFDPKNHF